MITRSGNQGFLAAHYDWILAGVGVLALVGAGTFYALALGNDADGAARRSVAAVERMRPQETGVKAVDMSAYQAAIRSTETRSRSRRFPRKAKVSSRASAVSPARSAKRRFPAMCARFRPVRTAAKSRSLKRKSFSTATATVCRTSGNLRWV